MSETHPKERLAHSALLHPLRLVVRAVRAGLNQLLHPLRRRSLRRRLADLPSVHRVLVLCLGNVCRSPYGAARLAHKGGELGSDGKPPRQGSLPGDERGGPAALEVRSAGLMGFGNPAPDMARRVAGLRGLDLEDHASQLLTPELVRWADLIVVMDPRQGKELEIGFGASPQRIAILGDLDPGLPARRDIPDPLGGPERFFQETYERMDRCLDELFTLIQGDR